MYCMCWVYGTMQRQEFSASCILFLQIHNEAMKQSHLKCIHGLRLDYLFCPWYKSLSCVFASRETNLFLHFFHLPDRTSSLGTLIVTVTQQTTADVIHLANVLLFLFFCLLQLALSTQTLTVVHVVCLHHLKKECKVMNSKNNSEL